MSRMPWDDVPDANPTAEKMPWDDVPAEDNKSKTLKVKQAVKVADAGFAENAAGAAFGNPRMARGVQNTEPTRPVKPLESFAAGFTNRAVAQPLLGITQFATAGNVGQDRARAIEEESNQYQSANPFTYNTGAVGGELGKAYLTRNFMPNSGFVAQGAASGGISGALSPQTNGATGMDYYGQQMIEGLKGAGIGAGIGGLIRGAIATPQIYNAGKDILSGAGSTITKNVAPPMPATGPKIPKPSDSWLTQSARQEVGDNYIPAEILKEWREGRISTPELEMYRRPISELPQDALKQTGGKIPFAGQEYRALGEQLGEKYKSPLSAVAEIGLDLATGSPIPSLLRAGYRARDLYKTHKAMKTLGAKGFSPLSPEEFAAIQAQAPHPTANTTPLLPWDGSVQGGGRQFRPGPGPAGPNPIYIDSRGVAGVTPINNPLVNLVQRQQNDARTFGADPTSGASMSAAPLSEAERVADFEKRFAESEAARANDPTRQRIKEFLANKEAAKNAARDRMFGTTTPEPIPDTSIAPVVNEPTVERIGAKTHNSDKIARALAELQAKEQPSAAEIAARTAQVNEDIARRATMTKTERAADTRATNKANLEPSLTAPSEIKQKVISKKKSMADLEPKETPYIEGITGESPERFNQLVNHLRNREYMGGVERDRSRVKATGEVFTPTRLAQDIMDNFKKPGDTTFTDPKKTFIDPAAGDGQLLSEAMLEKIRHGSTHRQALETTYGVDLMPDNVKLLRDRLLGGDESLRPIAEENLLVGNILDPFKRVAGQTEKDHRRMIELFGGREIEKLKNSSKKKDIVKANELRQYARSVGANLETPYTHEYSDQLLNKPATQTPPKDVMGMQINEYPTQAAFEQDKMIAELGDREFAGSYINEAGQKVTEIKAPIVPKDYPEAVQKHIQARSGKWSRQTTVESVNPEDRGREALGRLREKHKGNDDVMGMQTELPTEDELTNPMLGTFARLKGKDMSGENFINRRGTEIAQHNGRQWFSNPESKLKQYNAATNTVTTTPDIEIVTQYNKNGQAPKSLIENKANREWVEWVDNDRSTNWDRIKNTKWAKKLGVTSAKELEDLADLIHTEAYDKLVGLPGPVKPKEIMKALTEEQQQVWNAISRRDIPVGEYMHPSGLKITREGISDKYPGGYVIEDPKFDSFMDEHNFSTDDIEKGSKLKNLDIKSKEEFNRLAENLAHDVITKKGKK